jgi:hypothetical protein
LSGLPGHQARRCGRPTGRRWKEPRPFPIEELSIDQCGELYQFVAHIDQVTEARAKKIILFEWAIMVHHGRTELQRFKFNNTKP